MSRAAIRYAKAILDLAQDNKSAKAVNEDMALIANTISGNSDLQEFLQSAVIKSELKKDTLLKMFTNINDTSKGLLDVLVSNKRVNILQAVATNYQQLYDKAQGVVEAEVTTAVALTDDLKKKALAKVKELTGSDKVTLTNTINEDILGGFILRVGDKEYNASIANQLQKLKREFTLN